MSRTWNISVAKFIIARKVNSTYQAMLSTPNQKAKEMYLCCLQFSPFLGVMIDDEKTKPAIYKLYDFTKGGTDIVDQKMGSYTVKPKSRKWSIVAFSYLLDTIRVNTSTVFALNNGNNPTKINSFQLGFDLAEALVMAHIERRPMVGLTKPIVSKIGMFTNIVKNQNPCQAELPSSSAKPLRLICALKKHMETSTKPKRTKWKRSSPSARNVELTLADNISYNSGREREHKTILFKKLLPYGTNFRVY